MAKVLAVFLLIGLTTAFDRESAKIIGKLAAVYTPMKEDQTLDLDRIPAYAKWLAERNLTNIMPAGTTGESLSLTVAERKALTEAWVKHGVPLGLRVTPHIGAESIFDVLELAKHASETKGVSGILAQTPLYFKPSAESLAAIVRKVAAAAPSLPVWYYHFPDMTGVLPGKSHELLTLGNDIENFMGIKFTDYNLMDLSAGAQDNNGKWNMMFGRDEMIIAGFEFGAEAAASSTINYLKVTQQLVEKQLAGKFEEAKELQKKVTEVCVLLGNYPGKNVQKSIMKMVGMDVGPTRLPQADLSKSEFEELQKQLQAMDVLDSPRVEIQV